MVTTDTRIKYFTTLFENLTSTNSIVDKKAYLAEMPEEYKQDFQMILECLTGKVVFGYTWKDSIYGYREFTSETISDILNFLLEPIRDRNLTTENIYRHCGYVHKYASFFKPIVNRTLKLGIGNSLLTKNNYTPMLAKNLEDIQYISGSFTVTEKLDGNRCIAFYDGIQWNFVSRNGKPLHVTFDMSNYPKEYIYDGEILSPTQVSMSKEITNAIRYKLKDFKTFDKSLFNTTSGLINRHNTDKELVYNIFDIMLDTSYTVRRSILEDLRATVVSKNTRILPTLLEATSFEELMTKAPEVLDIVTNIGGEGLMINNNNCDYEHKRTKAILKYKKTHTMDMHVIGTEFGTGKYESMVGAIYCEAMHPETGQCIFCKVGSGLTDEQRWNWTNGSIIGKIVEVSYFDISDVGNAALSLRFPRLKRVRDDKITESIY